MGDVHVEVKVIVPSRDRYPDMPQADLEKVAFDKAMKKFSRKVQKSKIFDKYKEHTFFLKPSQKNHNHDNAVKYRMKMEKELGSSYGCKAVRTEKEDQ